MLTNDIMNPRNKTEPEGIRISRRDFLHRAALGTVVLANPHLTSLFMKSKMGIVVHSYALRWHSSEPSKRYPGFSNAIELLNHCHEIGAGGLQVGIRDWTADFAKKVRDQREKLGLYLEGSISFPKTEEDLPSFEEEVQRAKEAGATILRTVCHGGRRYEVFDSLDEFEEFKIQSIRMLELAEPVVARQKMKLAIENHKDWRADELAAIVKNLSSEWVGVTFDFGNSIALVEDPMQVAETLTPYVFSTHVKDMGVDQYEDGFLLSEVPLGEGILDLATMADLCTKHNPEVTFNLEMITRDPLQIPCLTDDYWDTFPGVSGRDLARTLRDVKTNRKEQPLPRVSHLGAEERLATEEQNILLSLAYSKKSMGLG